MANLTEEGADKDRKYNNELWQQIQETLQRKQSKEFRPNYHKKTPIDVGHEVKYLFKLTGSLSQLLSRSDG